MENDTPQLLDQIVTDIERPIDELEARVRDFRERVKAATKRRDELESRRVQLTADSTSADSLAEIEAEHRFAARAVPALQERLAEAQAELDRAQRRLAQDEALAAREVVADAIEGAAEQRLAWLDRVSAVLDEVPDPAPWNEAASSWGKHDRSSGKHGVSMPAATGKLPLTKDFDERIRMLRGAIFAERRDITKAVDGVRAQRGRPVRPIL